MSDWVCNRCGSECPEPTAELWANLDAVNHELRKRRGEKQVGVKEVVMCVPCYRNHRQSPHTSGVDFSSYAVPK